ncbi:hypothetical protein [Tropicibacter oceani]|uniref:Uncharacterized protein n=1 Tax=Tropicibacter oceani TaxID=3058420 RepID=A0ABY8QGZ7_9RHOB|nr:hypothetical protein [Tropicibacter oceani]WGW03905.1 hypothetical protein QF118_18620 [Tropicibacter oceani]
MTHISFLCPPDLLGKIPEPIPASKALPDWFRALPREMGMADAPFTPIAPHHPGQIGADKPPFQGKQPLKFINPWRVLLPPGWSAAFVHPINHFELPFRAFNGAVDCDALDVPVNIPFLWVGTSPDIDLPAGHPHGAGHPLSARRHVPDRRSSRRNQGRGRPARHRLDRKHTEESVYAREWRRRHERG